VEQAANANDLLADRYRLEEPLDSKAGWTLWRARDERAGGAEVVLRRMLIDDPESQAQLERLWTRWQGVLHPQIPRCAEAFAVEGALWLPRQWQEGRSLAAVLADRQKQQQVFAAAEVLQLVNHVLPALAVLHSHGLSHGALEPAQVLQREEDALPVLLDPALEELEHDAAVCCDLQALGALAWSLLGGESSAAQDMAPPFRHALERLLIDAPDQRFRSASAALQAFQQLPTLPKPLFSEPELERAANTTAESVASGSRHEQKNEALEQRLWPVVLAMAGSAVLGIALGWLLLTRGRVPAPLASPGVQLPTTLSPLELNQRQQLLNRLLALQIDRAWFLKLVDASWLAEHPERAGRLPGNAPADAALRNAWSAMAQEWLSRVEPLPMRMRMRLGRYGAADWRRSQALLRARGVSAALLEPLVAGSAPHLALHRVGAGAPPEPWRQLWYVAADQVLTTLQLEASPLRLDEPQMLSGSVQAGGARLFPIQLPPAGQLVLEVSGSPLLQMALFAADGEVLGAQGPLRLLNLAVPKRSPVQLLLLNQGLAPTWFTLSVRAEPPLWPQADADRDQ